MSRTTILGRPTFWVFDPTSWGVFVHSAGTACTARARHAQRGHSAHFARRNWGLFREISNVLDYTNHTTPPQHQLCRYVDSSVTDSFGVTSVSLTPRPTVVCCPAPSLTWPCRCKYYSTSLPSCLVFSQPSGENHAPTAGFEQTGANTSY